MATSVYQINKGINKPVEFKGLKAQYIWWLGGMVILLLILFAILYLAGVNAYLSVALILAVGTLTVMGIYRLSNRYGEFGMMKLMARRHIPTVVRIQGRKCFINLKKP